MVCVAELQKRRNAFENLKEVQLRVLQAFCECVYTSPVAFQLWQVRTRRGLLNPGQNWSPGLCQTLLVLLTPRQNQLPQDDWVVRVDIKLQMNLISKNNQPLFELTTG